MFRDYDNSHFHRNGDTLKHYSNTYVYNIDSLGNDSLSDIHRRDISSRIIENDKVRLIQNDTLICENTETSCFCVPTNNSDTLFYHSYKNGAVDTSFFARKTKDVGFKFWWNDKSSIQQSSSTQSSSSQIIVNNVRQKQKATFDDSFKLRIYSIDGSFKGNNIKDLFPGKYLIFETKNIHGRD